MSKGMDLRNLDTRTRAAGRSGQARRLLFLIAIIVGLVWYFYVADKKTNSKGCRPRS
jgi:hypothetical protein